MASQETWCLQFVHEAVENEPVMLNNGTSIILFTLNINVLLSNSTQKTTYNMSNVKKIS